MNQDKYKTSGDTLAEFLASPEGAGAKKYEYVLRELAREGTSALSTRQWKLLARVLEEDDKCP